MKVLVDSFKSLRVYFCLVEVVPSPSPTLVWVHSAAGLCRRFRTWFDKACKNYGEFLKFKVDVVNEAVRKWAEGLTGEEKTKVTEALIEYDNLVDGLSKFANLTSFIGFVSATDENLIKWVGDEIVSLGYCGFRERSSQYWLWDLRGEKLPHERKVKEVFAFFGLDIHLRIYGLSVPSQEQAESWLFEFLDNVKKWPRERLVWLVRNFYPLSDVAGGFWSVVRKIVELMSLSDVWEDILEHWKSDVQSVLKKTPQFEVLKTVLLSEWEAEKYLRGLAEDVEKEFLEKYGAVTADVEKVKDEFYDRAVELLRERVAPEERLREVYEQIKPLIPADKVELTRAGLWKAIRWAFMYPQWSVDVFASGHVFPLGFTTEEARAIASKIMEKVPIKRVVAPPPPVEHVKVRFLKYLPSIIGADMKVYGPFEEGSVAELPKVNADVLVKQRIATYELVPPPIKLTSADTARLADFFLDKLSKAGVALPTQYKGEFEKTMDIYKTYEENLAIIEKVADDIIRRVAPPIEVIGSDYTHDKLIAEGWKPIISIPRLEEALKAPGIGGSSSPELALEQAKRLYEPELFEYKVVKHYALDGRFPYTIFVKPKVAPPVPPVVPEKVSREEFYRAFDEALFEWIPHSIEGYKPGLAGRLHYEAPEFEAETLAKFSMDTVLSKWENVIAKEKEDAYRRYAETTPEHAKRILADVPEFARHLASSLVGKTDTELFEEAKAKVKARELSTEEIERLRRVARVKTDELGLEWSPKVWDAFWREYEARAKELWATRRVSYLEEELEDILRRVAPTPPLPPRPPVAPPKEIPVVAPPEFFVEPTAPPPEPISPMPFPRSPTTEERERLWRAFMYAMSTIGQDPYRWREAFRMHVLDRPYRFWGDLLSNFREFVEAVRTGREYRFLPLVTVPMPWRPEEKPEERKEDAIIHFIATKLYPTMDELIYALRTYGVESTEQQIKEAAKKAWKEKNVWFTSVPKEFIEALIGEKVD